MHAIIPENRDTIHLLVCKGDETLRINAVLRTLILAALALCLLGCMAAFADTNDFTFALNGGGDGYVVTGYTGNDAAVTVPDWYNGLPVTEIGSGAFQGNTAIRTVSLPSTVEKIGTSAFKNCSSLSKITSYTASANPPAAERLPGDADDNGRVDAYDALLVMQYDAGWDVSVEKTNADVNANGSVDLDDAVLIFRYDAGENVTLK